jgi:hypothetical protein
MDCVFVLVGCCFGRAAGWAVWPALTDNFKRQIGLLPKLEE